MCSILISFYEFIFFLYLIFIPYPIYECITRPRNKYNLYTGNVHTHFYVHNKRTILKPYRKKSTLNDNHAYRTNKTENEKKGIYCENSNKNFCCLSPLSHRSEIMLYALPFSVEHFRLISHKHPLKMGWVFFSVCVLISCTDFHLYSI